MSAEKEILPTDDVMFKIILGNPKHSRILIHFLNSVIESDSPITSVTIQNGEITKEFVNQKGSRLDIKATTDKGELINIEMQCGNTVYMGARSLFYWAKMFSGQLYVGGTYENLRRTVSINVLNFNLYKNDQYWNQFHITNKKTYEPMTDLLEIHFIELNKIDSIDENNPLTFWIEFLKHPHSKMAHEVFKKVPEIDEANHVFEDAKADPATRELLQSREKALMDYANDLQVATDIGKEEGLEQGREEGEQIGLEKGEQIGLEKGRKEGAHQKALATARNLIDFGLTSEQIAAATGLSIAEIETLK